VVGEGVPGTDDEGVSSGLRRPVNEPRFSPTSVLRISESVSRPMKEVVAACMEAQHQGYAAQSLPFGGMRC